MPMLLCERFAQEYAIDPRDVVFLNGKKVPGIASVECNPARLHQLTKPHHGDGAADAEKGWENRPVIVTIKYWTQDQETALWQLIDELWQPPGKPPRVQTVVTTEGVPAAPGEKRRKQEPAKPYILISHPITDRLHINAIVIKDLTSSVQASEGPGVWTFKLNCIHYVPPKANTGRKIKGAGHTLTPRGNDAKNGLSLDPSETEGVPKKAPAPNTGSS